MFEESGQVAPDIHQADDPAIRHCRPPERVWVDLHKILNDSRRGPGMRRGGVDVGYAVRGLMWARVMGDWGNWFGVVSVELVRGGRPVAVAPMLVPSTAITKWSLKADREMLGKASNRPTWRQLGP